MAALAKRDPAFLSAKAQKTLDELIAMLNSCAFAQPRHADLQSQMEAIRGKFKMLVTVLGVSSEYFPKNEAPTF